MNPLPGVTAQDVTEDRGGRNILRLPIAARGVCIGRAMSRVEGSEEPFGIRLGWRVSLGIRGVLTPWCRRSPDRHHVCHDCYSLPVRRRAPSGCPTSSSMRASSIRLTSPATGLAGSRLGTNWASAATRVMDGLIV